MANVSKHSPTAETSVTVDVDDAGGVCRILVDNHGGGQHAHGDIGRLRPGRDA